MAQDELKEALAAGAKIKLKASVFQPEIDKLTLKVLGILSEAPNQEVRRKALEKARRMLRTR